MGDHSMESGSSADVMVHHAFRILTSFDNSTGFSGPNNTSKFNPSMAIIIIVLISAFLFMGFFSIYVRRCTRSDENANTASQLSARNAAAASRPGQGLDKAIVEALPLVGFSLVKGLEGGKDLSECAVCLSEFGDDENLRLLPKCGHVFHPDCIDMWFYSHSTCPLCRASLLPPEGKEGVEGEEANFAEDFQNWVSSRGVGPNGETFTIHDGPPVPPNGSILELLSHDGADRILAESLRMTEQLDAGLSRKEGEDENAERAAGIRALNRALSKNASSFRKASRGFEASDRIDSFNAGSARFNSSSVVINMDAPNGEAGTDREAKRSRSIGSSHSLNVALQRSSSVGSSGRYLRQFFGGQDDQDGSRLKLLGSEHKFPIVNPSVRRERSANGRSNLEIPVWEDVDLDAEGGAGVNATTAPAPATSTVPGALPFERWVSRGRKFASAELPSPGAKRMDLPSGEPSGPHYAYRKEKDPQVEERMKSDRWNFGQSFRRTFSLKRTTSNSSDVESSSQQTPAASKPKKFGPWAGAMKLRRTSSAGEDVLPSPHSPSVTGYPESLSVDSAESLQVPGEQQLQAQHRQHQDQSHPKEDPITIVTQP